MTLNRIKILGQQLVKVQKRIEQIKAFQIADSNKEIPDEWMILLEESIKRLKFRQKAENKDYLVYPYRPIILDARDAHKKGQVIYSKAGVCSLNLPEYGISETINCDHQYPDNLRLTFDSLEKALSPMAEAQAVSPKSGGEKSLYDLLQEEREFMEAAQTDAMEKGKWSADYGNYVFDVREKKLFTIAPEFWHRLSLLTSTSTLYTDPKMELSWWEVRQIMESSVIGIVGGSVGGNIWEGYNRDNRPKISKIADFDSIESGNLNRLMGIKALGDLTRSRKEKNEMSNFYDIKSNLKADVLCYGNHMNDPYAKTYVFNEGINTDNMLEFLLGNGIDQPPVTIVVEEVDNFDLKVQLRQLCELLGIPLLMVSDFGHKTQMQFCDFARMKDISLGYHITGETLAQALDRAKKGKREDRIQFIEYLCGPFFKNNNGQFTHWAFGRGEQMSAALPQSGATALDAGGIGGRAITMYQLGFDLPANFVFNHITCEVESLEWENEIRI